jgi:hypothetical protein
MAVICESQTQHACDEADTLRQEVLAILEALDEGSTKIHGAVVEKKKTERLFAESIVAACEGKTSLSKHWQSI